MATFWVIFLAIKQLFLCHLPSKILTVIVAGVDPLHDFAVAETWNRIYLKRRFGGFLFKSLNRNPLLNYSFRFYLFCSSMADNIRRGLQNINLGIDNVPFTIPQAIVHQAVEENRFCLIGRPVMPRKQNLRQIIATLPRSWGLVGLARGRIVEQRRFQFIFPSEESLETVMRRGPWSFADRMLILEKWTPEMVPNALNFIPFWIQIRGIPLQFMNLGVINSIARSLGDRMEVDFDEATVVRVQFVRVRINWNVNHPLKFQRNFQFSPGENTVLSFFYERLRGFCNVCGMMTHDSGRCLIQNGGPENLDDDEDDNDDDEPQVGLGNPGVHIQEIGEDGMPIDDESSGNEAEHQEEQIVDAPNDGTALSDIDPDHNALKDISSGDSSGVLGGEGVISDANNLPSFVNYSGNIRGPIALLGRELRKRKQTTESETEASSSRKKVSVESNAIQVAEITSAVKEETVPFSDKDRAAVGPVPPPVP